MKCPKFNIPIKKDGEWYSGDETIYPELIIGKDQDNNFEPYIIINTPEHNEPEFLVMVEQFRRNEF